MSTNDIGGRIMLLRKQKGITQEQLAERMGVTNQSVSKWEQNICCPDISLLPRLADYFGVTIDSLFGRSGAENSLASVYLGIKELLKAAPEEETAELCFKLASLLHEGMVSHGYKGYIPWDSDKQYGLEASPQKWGTSICTEPQGCTVHRQGMLFFSLRKYWQKATGGNVHDICAELSRLSDRKTLKVLFTLFELTAENDDHISAEVLAEKAGLSEQQVIEALESLNVSVREDDGQSGQASYRIEGGSMHIPPLLMLLAK